MEAISDVHDGSTGEIRKGYFTVEAAVLSQDKKMPMPVYEKVFSSAEDGFVSMTHENLCCLKSLSAHFEKTVYARWTEGLTRMIITDTS
jgi:hypothetical protein